MEILTKDQICEWTNVESGVDELTLTMLEGAAIEHVEFLTNAPLLPYVSAIDGTSVVPPVPQALRHAIALYVSAHYDSRLAPDPAAMAAVAALCAPFRVWTL